MAKWWKMGDLVLAKMKNAFLACPAMNFLANLDMAVRTEAIFLSAWFAVSGLMKKGEGFG